MNQRSLFFLEMYLFLAILLFGCTSQQAANSQEAIKESKTKGSVQQQVDYLVKQGEAFINSKDYDDAVAVANHILANLDQNAQEAKNILTKASDNVRKTTQGTLQDLQKSTKDALEDIKNR
jgi:hypothetical protein